MNKKLNTLLLSLVALPLLSFTSHPDVSVSNVSGMKLRLKVEYRESRNCHDLFSIANGATVKITKKSCGLIYRFQVEGNPHDYPTFQYGYSFYILPTGRVVSQPTYDLYLANKKNSNLIK